MDVLFPKATGFISGGKKATSSLVDPGSIITLNGKKVGSSHDFSAVSFPQVWTSSYGFHDVVVVLYEMFQVEARYPQDIVQCLGRRCSSAAAK